LKSYLMMKGRPCICTKVSFAKPGKHGHVKCNIVGADLLIMDKKYQHMCPGHEMIEIPEVKKYDLAVSHFETSNEGKDVVIDEIVAFTEDSDEITLKYKDEDPMHREAHKLFKELEANEDDTKEVVLSIIQATVGQAGNYSWEEKIDKVQLRVAD